MNHLNLPVMLRVKSGWVAQTPDKPTDAQILSCFITKRDEHAFSQLVRRHGPMVLAICRRMTRDYHLADDTFQAAFLVLARRAKDIKPRTALRAWLYGVAVRCALETRSMTSRRRSREALVATVPESPVKNKEKVDAEDVEALDHEISRLPIYLREVVVACELDGFSRREVARRFGIPEGTVSSRLAKARKLLVIGLKRRNVQIPAMGLSVLCSGVQVTASMPLELFHNTVRLISAGPGTALIAELTKGVVKAMILKKMRLLIAGIGLLIALGGSSAVYLQPALNPETNASEQISEKQQMKVVPGQLLFCLYDEGPSLHMMDDSGKNEHQIDLPKEALGGILSPDGRTIAFWESTQGDANPRQSICVRPLSEKGSGTRYDVPFLCGFLSLCWSPDGKEIVTNMGVEKAQGVAHIRIDIKNKKLLPMNTLGSHLITDLTRNGKSYLTMNVGNGEEWEPKSLHIVNIDGSNQSTVITTKNHVVGGKLSPDGRVVLCMSDGRLSMVEVGNPKSLKAVEGIPEKDEVTSHAWSPDGNQIAYTIGTVNFLDKDEQKAIESRLVIANSDGKNPKVVKSVKGKVIGDVSWHQPVGVNVGTKQPPVQKDALVPRKIERVPLLADLPILGRMFMYDQLPQNYKKQVPILGDLPYVGRLFVIPR